MTSTFSQNGIELQGAGDNLNTWGDPKLNNALKRLNYLDAGYQAVTITGDTTLTSSNTSTTQADFQAYNALIKLTGSPTANFAVTVPSLAMRWFFWNATAYTATITTGAGTTYAVEAGDKLPINCDGSGVFGIAFGAYTLKEYFAVFSASAGAVPGVTGNAGKYLYTDGASALWRQAQSTDLGDYDTAIKGLTVAMGVAL
jgi:hypothetical protein